MVELAAAMGTVLVYWAVLFPAFVGMGLATRSLAGERDVTRDSAFASFWLGYALCIGLLQLWHFWQPIQWPAGLMVAAIGWLCLLARTGRVAKLVGHAGRTKPVVLASLVVVVLWLANRAIGPATTLDAGVYHTHAIKWMATYPLVPGLANLNTQIGFNSSQWLYSALYEIGPLSGRGNHGPVALLLAVALLQSTASASKLLRRDPSADVGDAFDAMLLVPAIHLILSADICDNRTDLPSIWLTFVVAARFFRLLFNTGLAPATQRAEVLTIAVVSAAAVAVKLPAAVFCGLMTLVASGLLLRQHGRSARGLIAVGWSVAVVIGLSWLARGIVISGYPFFPMPFLKADVPWRVPLAATEALHAWVKHYAWIESTDQPHIYTGFAWIVPWAKHFAQHDPFKFVYPMLVLCVIVAVLVYGRIKGGKIAIPGVLRLALIPIVVSLFAWFVSAPASRWAMTMAWTMVGAGAMLIFAGLPLLTPARRGWLLAAFSVCLIFPPVVARLVFKNNVKGGPLERVVKIFVLGPGSDSGFHPMKQVPLQEFVTDSGLKLTVPVDGDAVYDAPVPATPHPVRNLRLRVSGDLSKGFVIDGESWDPGPNWPNVGSTFWPNWQKHVAQRALPGR